MLRLLHRGLAHVFGTVAALLVLVGLAPTAHARLVLYQSCHYETDSKSPCTQVHGSVADLERYIPHRLWNEQSVPCRDLARQTPEKVWEQALEIVGDAVVHTCIAPDTGRRFRSVVLKTGVRANIDTYNRQHALRLSDEMSKRPTPGMLSNPGQACVPITLFSMLHAGRPAPAPADFAHYMAEMAAGLSVGTVSDVRRYFDFAGGVKLMDVKELFADHGLPLQGLRGDLTDAFDAIGDSLDQGKVVAVYVDALALLRAGQQYDGARRKLLALGGPDLDTLEPTQHLARVVAVRRTPAGTVAALAVYDPALFLLGNEPYWVEPRALHLALYRRLLPRLDLSMDRVFISQRALLPALRPH